MIHTLMSIKISSQMT